MYFNAVFKAWYTTRIWGGGGKGAKWPIGNRVWEECIPLHSKKFVYKCVEMAILVYWVMTWPLQVYSLSTGEAMPPPPPPPAILQWGLTLLFVITMYHVNVDIWKWMEDLQSMPVDNCFRTRINLCMLLMISLDKSFCAKFHIVLPML